MEIQPPTTRKFLEFDCGSLLFQGSETQLRGRLLFEFPHQWLDPDPSKMSEIRDQMSEWIDQNLDSVPAAHCHKVMEETVNWIYFAMPPFQGDELTQNRKRLSFGKYTLMAWIHDSFDALKSRDDYLEFLRWSRNMIKLIFQGHFYRDPENSGLAKILRQVEESGFAERHPCVRTYFRLCHEVALDLLEYPTLQIQPYVRAYLRQYDHDTWLDLPTTHHLANLNLRKTTRYYSVGGVPFVEFSSILQGIQLTDEERHEKHLKRIKFLLISQAAIINDLFSLKKEVAQGEPDNLVLLLCAHKKLTVEQSVEKLIRKHDKMAEEAAKIHQFLVNQYPPHSSLIRWLEVLRDITKHVLVSSLHCLRYGDDFKGKIVFA